MTAPTELPDTLEIAKIRLRTPSGPISSPLGSFALVSSSLPMTLAVKKPARLAPPDAAIRIGRGHLDKSVLALVGVLPQIQRLGQSETAVEFGGNRSSLRLSSDRPAWSFLASSAIDCDAAIVRTP